MTKIPKTMRAFVLTGHGEMDRLEYHTDWPVPAVGPNQVLIRVKACGLNNTDVNTRTAWYSKGVSGKTTGEAFDGAEDNDAGWGGAAIQFPRIQGIDISGVAVAVGEGADPSIIGKRVLVDLWMRDHSDPLNYEKAEVFGSECDGGFAEYTVMDYRNLVTIDSHLSDEQLATFSCAYITAENMLNRANVVAGDRVLITGASGGVGSALVQLVQRRGAIAVAMCAESKQHRLAQLKPAAMLPRFPENLKQALMDSTGHDQVDVVADIVGGSGWADLIEVLVRGGRYTCAGAIAGPMVEMDLRTFYLRDLTFTGATVAPPGVLGDVAGYIERGEIVPLLAASYPLAQLKEAQAAFIAKAHAGNIVVTMD